MASWAPPIGDERVRKPTSPLQQLLAQRDRVAPPRPLPPQAPRNNLVSTPHALPPQIGYGSTQMGVPQSSRFTGGVSQNPVSLVQPQDTSFQAPSYGLPSQPVGIGGAQHPSSPAGLSALAAALSPPSPGISGPTPSSPSLSSPTFGPASKAFIQQYGTAPSVYLPQQQTIRSQTAPAPIAQVQPPLGATLANAAQRGYKPIYQI